MKILKFFLIIINNKFEVRQKKTINNSGSTFSQVLSHRVSSFAIMKILSKFVALLFVGLSAFGTGTFYNKRQFLTN